jgi:hypothetical protein
MGLARISKLLIALFYKKPIFDACTRQYLINILWEKLTCYLVVID